MDVMSVETLCDLLEHLPLYSCMEKFADGNDLGIETLPGCLPPVWQSIAYIGEYHGLSAGIVKLSQRRIGSVPECYIVKALFADQVLGRHCCKASSPESIRLAKFFDLLEENHRVYTGLFRLDTNQVINTSLRTDKDLSLMVRPYVTLPLIQ
jgi:hypothetical protein